jgi:hypothetical protein
MIRKIIIRIRTHVAKYLAKHVPIPKIDGIRIDSKRIFPSQQLNKEEDKYGV